MFFASYWVSLPSLAVKATIHGATLLLATVVTRLWQPCSRVVTAWLQPGYNCCKQQSCPVYDGLKGSGLTPIYFMCSIAGIPAVLMIAEQEAWQMIVQHGHSILNKLCLYICMCIMHSVNVGPANLFMHV